MPELPEVQTVVSTLSPAVSGQTIVAVTLHRTDILTPRGFDLQAGLRNRVIATIYRRGKRIVFGLDNGNYFYIHLGMSGRLTLDHVDAPVQKHTHLLIDMPGKTQIRLRDPRRFGGVFWMGTTVDDPALGPEPLAIRATEFAEKLAKTKRSIKTTLLDQRVLAGVGNIYADEALFEAGIDPRRRADRLTRREVDKLTLAIKRVLKRAIHHRGSTLRDYVDANGAGGTFQNLHRVYGRDGQPCLKCGANLRRIVLGGRSTHYCPRCQSGRKAVTRPIAGSRRRAARATA